MKLFSVEEANALLPTVKAMVFRIRRAYTRLLAYSEASKRAAEGAERGGGGMIEGPQYVSLLMELSSQTAQLDALGVQMKDYGRGLIDFPSLREGRIVLLCWELGEGDALEWWHDVDAGYAGRQPL